MPLNDIVPRQDSSAEIALANLFGLDRILNRMADADANDEDGNPYQFKASTKAGISTARNFGPATIDKLRRAYLIVAYGRNYQDRFEVDRTFFFSRSHIEPWLSPKEQHFIKEQEEADHIITACRRDGFDDNRLDLLRRRLHYGMLINDPNIPKRYILKHGIEITQAHPSDLRRLVREHPLAL